jgi:dienelactone hydrolase
MDSVSSPPGYAKRSPRRDEAMTDTHNAELPDPFRFQSGRRVKSVADWRKRRRELTDAVIEIEYGGLPPSPSGVTGEVLHAHKVRRFHDASYTQYRLINNDDQSFHFRVDVLVPPGEGPFPVVLTGDGCYRYVSDDITLDILRRGFILAQFSRTAIVPDVYNSERANGLYRVYPDAQFGALAAWAWGYHRCVDFLLTLDAVRPDGIAVVGHSRGGKTALLAGATDERIALTAPNGSGSGGAGCFRWQGPKSETLADSKRQIPYWYGPRLWDFVGREHALPFDQHSLKALVAPRALLSTEGLDDLWSNPSGTWQTHLAAREVYRFLDAENRIGIWFRDGGHDHGQADWGAFLDFMEWQLCGKESKCCFDRNPYPDMAAAFTWSTPDIVDRKDGEPADAGDASQRA